MKTNSKTNSIMLQCCWLGKQERTFYL